MQFLILFAAVSGVLCGVRRSCPDYACDQYGDTLVCGTDGNTYKNSCYLKQMICKSTSSVKIDYAYDGPCRTVDPARTTDGPVKVTPGRLTSSDCQAPPTCDDTVYKICGSDRITYQNKCYFLQAECKFASISKTLTVEHLGECRSSTGSNPMILDVNPCMEAKLCSSTTAVSICGSDGVTYVSKCDFLMSACKNYQNNIKLTAVSSGSCGSKVDTSSTRDPCDATIRCSNDREKICASDRTTYASECEFNLAVCVAAQTNQPKLTQVKC